MGHCWWNVAFLSLWLGTIRICRVSTQRRRFPSVDQDSRGQEDTENVQDAQGRILLRFWPTTEIRMLALRLAGVHFGIATLMFWPSHLADRYAMILSLSRETMSTQDGTPRKKNSRCQEHMESRRKAEYDSI
jgi:hypothetical protein